MTLPGTRAWTTRERKAAGALAAAWIAGTLAGWIDLDGALARAAESALHPPRPSVAELADRVGPGDPRPEWYAAALRLRAEEELAESAPARIDPNAAGRAEWDRHHHISGKYLIAYAAEDGVVRGHPSVAERHATDHSGGGGAPSPGVSSVKGYWER